MRQRVAPTVAVVGAGIGGLALALALVRRGFDVQVLEQAAACADVGAGLQLSPNATRCLADLGLLQANEPAGRLHPAAERTALPPTT